MTIKTILVVGADLCIRKEGIAAGVITPGHLIQGPATDLVVHANAGQVTQKAFALENEVVGGEIGTDYADNDTVLYAVCPAGAVVFAIADGVGVTAEDFVESNGNGTMLVLAAHAATADTERNSLVGKAIDTAGAGVRFRLEVY